MYSCLVFLAIPCHSQGRKDARQLGLALFFFFPKDFIYPFDRQYTQAEGGGEGEADFLLSM